MIPSQRLTASAAALLCVLSACGTCTADDGVKVPIVYRGVYAVRVRSLDPATCNDTMSGSVQGEVFEGLYTYHYLKHPFAVIPQLAAAMPQVSPDGLTWTIPIRKGVRYHRHACFGVEADGRCNTRTVEAGDFVLAIKRIADSHLRSNLAWSNVRDRVLGADDYRKKTEAYDPMDFKRYDLPVEGVTAPDAHTLRIKLIRPCPQFLYFLATHVCAPIPREAVDRLAKMGRPFPIFARAEDLVGTGPYVLAEHRPGERIVLERNPEYRDDFYPAEGAPGDQASGLLADAGRRVPFIDEFRFDYSSSADDAWSAFLARRTGACGIPREVFHQVVTKEGQLSPAYRQRDMVLVTSTPPAVYWLIFNMDDPVLGASKSLRQAMCLALDRKAYIVGFLDGRATAPTGILPSALGLNNEARPAPYSAFDLDAAKAKLLEARKELARADLIDGVNDDLPAITLDLADPPSMTEDEGKLLAGQFARIGMTVKPVYREWADLNRRLGAGKSQVLSMGWHLDYPDPQNVLQLFYSKNIETGLNYPRYANPAFDKLYERAVVMPDSPERTKLYSQLARLIDEDCPVLPVSEPVQCFLHYRWVCNVKPHPFGYGYHKYWRIDTKLRDRSIAGQ